MRRLLASALLFSSASASGCFELPTFERPDAPGLDGRRSAFAVVGTAVEGFDGRLFPGEIPRRPRFVVTFSARPDVATPVYLFSGAAADELASDLGTAPLRASSEEVRLPAAVEERFGALVVTPDAPLPAGAEVVLAVPAWATGGGVRLATPFLATFVVSRDPALGAAAVETWPPDRATGIGPEVPLFAVRFDGVVAMDDRALSLRTAGGSVVDATVRLGPCAEIGWTGADCAMLEPASALVPRTEHLLRVEGAIDGTGAPLAPFEIRVTTGETSRAPVLGALVCAPDEADAGGLCVFSDDRTVAVRVIGSEPLRLALDTDGGRVRTVLPRGEGAIALSGLAADTFLPATLAVTNASGRTLEVPLELATTEPLAELAIVEVRADPLGREPAQEYVELENRGASAVELSEMRLSDALLDDGDPLPPMLVAPGARVLVVATGFDPDALVDGIVPAGVGLVRLDASIASGGLSSFGEPLYLRDADGHRLSAVPARPTEPGACLVRTVDDARRGDASAFVEAPCTPGTAP